MSATPRVGVWMEVLDRLCQAYAFPHVCISIFTQVHLYASACKKIKFVGDDRYLGSFVHYQGYIMHNYHMIVWTAILDADYASAMRAAVDVQGCTSRKMLVDFTDFLEGMCQYD